MCVAELRSTLAVETNQTVRIRVRTQRHCFAVEHHYLRILISVHVVENVKTVFNLPMVAGPRGVHSSSGREIFAST